MGPNLRHPFIRGSFFTDRETRDIGGGIVLWRGYFQSVRPAIGRMLINVDISTGAMFMPGPLIGLALAHLNLNRPDALAPRGLPDRERLRLQRFITGLEVTTSHGQREPGRQGPRRRVVKKLSKEGARDLSFELDNGQRMTVADYFQGVLGGPLRYPEVICVEVCTRLHARPLSTIDPAPQLSTGALIPLELCKVPPGQIIRKQVPPDKTNSVLDFATKHPNERLASICNGLNVCPCCAHSVTLLTIHSKVLEYGQSEYVRQFGMTVADQPLRTQARVINAPTLKYHKSSKQPSAVSITFLSAEGR